MVYLVAFGYITSKNAKRNFVILATGFFKNLVYVANGTFNTAEKGKSKLVFDL